VNVVETVFHMLSNQVRAWSMYWDPVEVSSSLLSGEQDGVFAAQIVDHLGSVSTVRACSTDVRAAGALRGHPRRL
jgi:hypothetical protein